MDFSSDDCLSYFTKLQATYMQDFAHTFKSELINSADCFVTNIPRESDFRAVFSDGLLNVYLGKSLENSQFYIFSIGGSLIKQCAIKSENYIKLRIDGISLGTYLLVIKQEGGLHTRKIFLY